MKHIKFNFAEPIVGIQRVRNEVFLESDCKLNFSSSDMRDRVEKFIKGICPEIAFLHRSTPKSPWNQLILNDQSGYHFESTLDEIFIIKGYDEVYVVDELGNVTSQL